MANTVMQISELDFDTIKNNLKTFLRSQSQFADFDFEGAGMNILLDVLAYNTHYMGYYVNMVGNEMFLDSAQLRDSIVSHAKNLNYVPTSRRGSVANVSIVVTPPDGNSTSTLVMPRYTEFQSEAIDGTNYTFLTLDAHAATKNLISNTFTFNNIQITEGERLSFDFNVTDQGILTTYILPNEGIDTSTLKVDVQTSTIDTSANTFTLAEDLVELNANSKVYFLSEANNKQYGIYFGDGILGKSLANGNIIKTNFLIVNGANSNYANTFTSANSIYGFSNVIVTTNSFAAGGTDQETDEEVRFRAPYFYTAQNRALSDSDYAVLLLKDYPNVESVSVWGGADNDPVVYGKVFISMKPVDGYVITNLEKERIKEQLISNRNVMTVFAEIVDPEYLYLILKARINYDISKTNYSADEIKAIVRGDIVDYVNSELGEFNKTFKYSRLQNVIDEADASIENSDLTVLLQKRLSPTLGSPQNYTINFNTSLKRGGLFDKMYTYPSFTIFDSEGVTRTAYIEEVPYSYTGVDSIDVTNPGYGYTVAPTVTITGDGQGATAIAEIVNGRVNSIIVTNRGSDYTIATITLTGDGQGAEALAVLSAKIGTLRSYYFKENGEKIILESELGDIDYENGVLNLFNFSPISITENQFYSNGILTFNIQTDFQTIEPLRNRIIDLDVTDPLSIQLTTKET